MFKNQNESGSFFLSLAEFLRLPTLVKITSTHIDQLRRASVTNCEVYRANALK
jgi:hypothetical protein